MKFTAEEIYKFYLSVSSKYAYKYKEVDIVYISQVYISEYLLGLYEEKRITKYIKRYSLDDLVKYLYYKKGDMFTRKSHGSSFDISFFFEINNKSMIDNLYNLYSYMLKNKNVRLCGNNQKLLDDKIINVFYYSNIVKSCFNMQKVKNDLKDLAALIADEIIQKDRDLNKKKVLNHLYRHFLSNVFSIDTMDEFVKDQSSNKFVLVTDVHKWSRILTILAKVYDKKTYVLQHGATVLEYGYLPITTDNFLAWGELSKEWLVRKGEDSRPIKVLGSPKFDELYKLAQTNITSNKHVLVILNPIGREGVEKFFSIILPGLKKLKEKTIIKLHPSSDDNRDLVEEYFNENFFEIQKNSNTLELVREAKCIITTTSSVGVEAILLKKPLLQVKIDGMPVMDYENYFCQHDIVSAEDLINIYMNKIILNSKIKNYDRFINDYCFALDGKNMQRIREYIEK